MLNHNYRLSSTIFAFKNYLSYNRKEDGGKPFSMLQRKHMRRWKITFGIKQRLVNFFPNNYPNLAIQPNDNGNKHT